MKFSILNRSAALVASTTLLAGGTVLAGAGSASANNITYVIFDGSTARGSFDWSGDPHDGQPGDAFRVKDDVADGWGIEADLNTAPMRIATTSGHASTYTTPWKTGNLPEGKSYTLDVFLVKKGTYKYIRSWTVTS